MKKTKYNARKTKIDGITFDSKLESEFYLHLKFKKRRKQIKSFELQPSYIIQPSFKYQGKTIRAIKYTADFLIVDNNGNETIIDIKGKATKEALLRRKCFLVKYPDKNLVWLKRDKSGWIDYFRKNSY